MPEQQSAPDPAALAAQLEQLQSRVDALEAAGEDAVEGLIATTGLSRRRVLQGLAAAGVSVAALGAATDEAQAQAVGDVGSDSARVNVFAESVDAGTINNVVHVAEGDGIQTVLDGLNRPNSGSNNRDMIFVVLETDATYDITSGISVPGFTYLCFNGAEITAGVDIPIVDLSAPCARLMGPGTIRARGGADLSNPALKVDATSSNFDNNLTKFQANTVGSFGPQIEIIVGADDPGPGLSLEATDHAIAVGCYFNVAIRGPDEHIVLDTKNGNWVNGVMIDYVGERTAGTANIIHKNTAGAAAEGRVFVRGGIQCDSGTYGIRNETSEKSIWYQGQIWDTNSPTDSVVSGPGLVVDTMNPIQQSQVDLGIASGFGGGSTVNGMSWQALGGSAPDATNWQQGNIVMDTDNAGDAYLVYDHANAGDVTQIGT